MGHGQASATSREDSTLRLRQFERVVEGLDEMIVVADLQYRIVLANRSFLSTWAEARTSVWAGLSRKLSARKSLGNLWPNDR